MTWDKRTKTIAGISLAMIVLVMILIMVSKRKKKQESGKEENHSESDPNRIDLSPEREINSNPFPLKRGKSGKEVEQAQLYLQKTFNASFPAYGIDGKWGSETEANMRKYLRKNSISKEFFYKTGMDQLTTTIF